MNKFINLFLDISPSLTIAHYGFLPRTSCLNGLFMENEYIHIIFDDRELHALLSLGTRYALDTTELITVPPKIQCTADQVIFMDISYN